MNRNKPCYHLPKREADQDDDTGTPLLLELATWRPGRLAPARRLRPGRTWASINLDDDTSSSKAPQAGE